MLRRRSKIVLASVAVTMLVILSLVGHHPGRLQVPSGVKDKLYLFKISLSDNVITMKAPQDDEQGFLSMDSLELEGLAETAAGTHAFNMALYKQFEDSYKNVDLLDDRRSINLFKIKVGKANENSVFSSLSMPRKVGLHSLKDQNEIALSPDYASLLHFQHNDPRFTFGLLLHHLTQQLNEGKAPDIPIFHWGDYLDLTLLTPYYFKLLKDSCSKFDFRTTNPTNNLQNDLTDPRRFCIMDDDIDKKLASFVDPLSADDLLLRKNLQLIQKNPFKAGFHTYANVGRATTVTKLIAAKSYLNDFMPFPKSIHFILPHTKTFSVPVEPQDTLLEGNNKRRLFDSEIFNDYISKNTDQLAPSGNITLDIKAQLRSFLQTIKEKNAPTTSQPLTYLKHLTHEDFTDNSKEYLTELSAVQPGKLSPADQLYLDSLRYSEVQDKPPKYFSEARLLKKEPNWAIGGHYDWKFFNGIINLTDKQLPALHGLIKAWLRFTNSNNLSTWIAHGSLLSWYWNGVSFPWDNDIDVQMPIDDLHRLARKFNQSIIVDFGHDSATDNGEITYGRYFMDCSTYIPRRIRGNGLNNIDARFIDLDTGLYIDITGLATSDTPSPARYDKLISKPELGRSAQGVSDLTRNDNMQVYNCKNNHFSSLNEITPLKLTFFEGEYARIPNGFQQLLVNEYDTHGITSLVFKGYVFVPRLRIWVEATVLNKHIKDNPELQVVRPDGTRIRVQFDKELKTLGKFQEQDYINVLLKDDSLLNEYLVTGGLTEFHEIEVLKLLSSDDASGMFFNATSVNPIIPPISLRHDLFTFNAFKNKYNFNQYLVLTVNDVTKYKLSYATFLENKKIAEEKLKKEQEKEVIPAVLQQSQKTDETPQEQPKKTEQAKKPDSKNPLGLPALSP